jgi:OPA family glycerol-3-phosphate transporter-like MFS transporter
MPTFTTLLAQVDTATRVQQELVAILILLAVVGFVFARLPRIDVGHSAAFKRRRLLNWLPLGLTYAFLYMGRYNLTVSKNAFSGIRDASGGALMSNADFATIFLVGTVVYGASFLLNGPLTDRLGGKFSILTGAGGSALMNGLMAWATHAVVGGGPGGAWIVENFVLVFSLLYGANMYFQSFGAVAIVKVNAPWFHVRERGVFGAIFGILISLGIYIAFDVGRLVLESLGDTLRVDGTSVKNGPGMVWLFAAPAVLLVAFLIVNVFTLRNSPAEAGHGDFDTADASSGDTGERLGVAAVFSRMLKNPVIMTIAAIEFCSGFLRQAIMQWYQTFAKQTDAALGLKSSFVNQHWGVMLCCAGILGGMFAGAISDHVFHSRRGPVAAVLYAFMLVGALVLCVGYEATWLVGPLVVFMSLAVIGVHGMLSGTASMDFGGRKNVGVAVGIIDGFVYMGTGFMSAVYGFVLPREQFDEAGNLVGPATDPAEWLAWPIAMVPMAAIGLVLATRVWNAKPKASGGH